MIAGAPNQRLYIINCSARQPFAPADQGPLELARRDGTVIFYCDVSQVSEALGGHPSASWTLITNLSEPDVTTLERQLSAIPRVLGYHMGTGLWSLACPTLGELPQSWKGKRAIPLGRPAAAALSYIITNMLLIRLKPRRGRGGTGQNPVGGGNLVALPANTVAVITVTYNSEDLLGDFLGHSTRVSLGFPGTSRSLIMPRSMIR